jgi:hypothetical protein
MYAFFSPSVSFFLTFYLSVILVCRLFTDLLLRMFVLLEC